MAKKIEYKAIVLTMPKKVRGTHIVFPIAKTMNGRIDVSITNDPDWTPSVTEIIIVRKSYRL